MKNRSFPHKSLGPSQSKYQSNSWGKSRHKSPKSDVDREEPDQVGQIIAMQEVGRFYEDPEARQVWHQIVDRIAIQLAGMSSLAADFTEITVLTRLILKCGRDPHQYTPGLIRRAARWLDLDDRRLTCRRQTHEKRARTRLELQRRQLEQQGRPDSDQEAVDARDFVDWFEAKHLPQFSSAARSGWSDLSRILGRGDLDEDRSVCVRARQWRRHRAIEEAKNRLVDDG